VTGPGQVEVVTLPLPEPGPGEVRVRLEGCGVCASNLEPWAGPDWMQLPDRARAALGHEGWGVVDALGEGVEGLEVGERVAVLNQHGYASHDVVRADQAVRLPARARRHALPGRGLRLRHEHLRAADIGPGTRSR
jgi:threonine dehydrogenase-like Zn-dependent dehydrogenase